MASWIEWQREWNWTRKEAVPLRLQRTMGPQTLASSPPRLKTLECDKVWSSVNPPRSQDDGPPTPFASRSLQGTPRACDAAYYCHFWRYGPFDRLLLGSREGSS